MPAGPQEVPLFPLHTVLFPRNRLPLRIFEPRYKQLLEEALKHDGIFGITLIKEGVEAGGPATPFEVGTLAQIESVDYRKDDVFVLCRGLRRFRIRSLKRDKPYLVAEIVPIEESATHSPAESQAAQQLSERFRTYVDQMRRVAAALGAELQVPSLPTGQSPGDTAFSVAFILPSQLERKQELLEETDLLRFLQKLQQMLETELKFLEPEP